MILFLLIDKDRHNSEVFGYINGNGKVSVESWGQNACHLTGNWLLISLREVGSELLLGLEFVLSISYLMEQFLQTVIFLIKYAFGWSKRLTRPLFLILGRLFHGNNSTTRRIAVIVRLTVRFIDGLRSNILLFSFVTISCILTLGHACPLLEGCGEFGRRLAR